MFLLEFLTDANVTQHLLTLASTGHRAKHFESSVLNFKAMLRTESIIDSSETE